MPVKYKSPYSYAIRTQVARPGIEPKSYIFGFLNGNETPIQIKNKTRDIISRTNKYLKKIGKEIGIDGLSTCSARHSYATVLKRSGANIAYISESLGHSNLKTAENYFASFERDERKKNAKLLTDFKN
ncbi:MAG: tyrosine-type recombinase/integrase [Tannerella sp.]|nr:tyrosine-type recombinase/integrase [Tannerella sp.]